MTKKLLALFTIPFALLILFFVQCGNPNLLERTDIFNYKFEAAKTARQLSTEIIEESYKAIRKVLPEFVWPVANLECGTGCTSVYGYRVNPNEGFFEFHEGVDFTGNIGDPV